MLRIQLVSGLFLWKSNIFSFALIYFHTLFCYIVKLCQKGQKTWNFFGKIIWTLLFAFLYLICSIIFRIYTYMLSTSVLLVSLFVFYYLSYQHQVATVKVMQHLNSPRNNLLFLMPCHLTPLYRYMPWSRSYTAHREKHNVILFHFQSFTHQHSYEIFTLRSKSEKRRELRRRIRRILQKSFTLVGEGILVWAAKKTIT